MGEMGPEPTELEISERFGGGAYRCEGKNHRARIVRVKQFKIAGEPKFASEADEIRWRRSQGLPPKPREPGTPGPETLTIKDVLLLLESRDEKRRQDERDREELRRAEEARIEEKRRQDAEERERSRRLDEEERERRRRRELEEADERRRQLAREDEERRRQQHREDMDRQAKMFESVLTLTKAADSARPAVDPTAALLQGVDLAMRMNPGGGGEAPKSAAASFFENVGPMLPSLLQGAARELGSGGGGGGGARPRLRRRAAPGGSQAAPGADPDALVVRGPMARKLRTLAGVLQARGQDPERAIDGLVAMLAKGRPASTGGETGAKPAESMRAAASSSAPARPPGGPVPARPVPRMPTPGSSGTAARRPAVAAPAPRPVLGAPRMPSLGGKAAS